MTTACFAGHAESVVTAALIRRVAMPRVPDWLATLSNRLEVIAATRMTGALIAVTGRGRRTSQAGRASHAEGVAAADDLSDCCRRRIHGGGLAGHGDAHWVRALVDLDVGLVSALQEGKIMQR